MINMWGTILIQKSLAGNDKQLKFLEIVLEVIDDRKQEIVGSPRGMYNGLINELRNHYKRDRTSKYDNVPEDEHAFLEEKTDNLEHTKL